MATRISKDQTVVRFEGELDKPKRKVPGSAISVEAAKAHAKAAGLKKVRILEGGDK